MNAPSQLALLDDPTAVTTPRENLELVFEIEIPGRLPSWNEILGMEQWARYKFKGQIQEDFLSALRQSAIDSSTRIMPAKNITSIAADTLDSYLTTARERRKLRRARKKRSPAAENLFASKSTGKPPF